MYGLIKRAVISVKLIPEATKTSDEQIKSDIIKDFSNMNISWCAEVEKLEIFTAIEK